ncbi:Hydrogen peroxide-inducible genes activator [Granulosicoccus antarcticus IMCC3135]|uniref:Hydrogen peroxide-inducible genes activator n=1 Tax=Granulosicoccus antarcticus IMCC3135 TaxID=1192854 RepID=A0A2Z2P8Y7_9GAMM|nr:LysR family transcriptional regulator [Granulosicoccus antarcticus]ASJ76354.1 Hydrogen peroxide-inducible genes activator [Granulosicoccus antarcticus IMCC3135]
MNAILRLTTYFKCLFILLSAAGRVLGLTQPTLGRQVSALEKELGVALFDRVGKRLVLTPSGLELVDHVRQMSDAADRISMVASGQSQELDGEVCITATEAFSVFLLSPIINKIRQAFPAISIEVLASDRLSNLSRREADIAVRNIRPTQPDLIARKICDVSARLYGASVYLDRLGRPITKQILSQADYTGFARSDDMIDTFRGLGLPLKAQQFPVVSENILVQWELVKLGGALGMMMESVGDEESLVERVQADSASLQFPIWLVAHQQLKSSNRIRAVFEVLADSLSMLSGK